MTQRCRIFTPSINMFSKLKKLIASCQLAKIHDFLMIYNYFKIYLNIRLLNLNHLFFEKSILSKISFKTSISILPLFSCFVNN